jgi:hypothetical protein
MGLLFLRRLLLPLLSRGLGLRDRLRGPRVPLSYLLKDVPHGLRDTILQVLAHGRPATRRLFCLHGLRPRGALRGTGLLLLLRPLGALPGSGLLLLRLRGTLQGLGPNVLLQLLQWPVRQLFQLGDHPALRIEDIGSSRVAPLPPFRERPARLLRRCEQHAFQTVQALLEQVAFFLRLLQVLSVCGRT